jgi:hypothetical protein
MLKPICVKCRRFYRPLKNGLYFREGMAAGVQRADPGIENDAQWTDYKLWSGDLWRCLGCGSQIIVGVGLRPIAEHYQDGFKEAVAASNAVIRVNDC